MDVVKKSELMVEMEGSVPALISKASEGGDAQGTLDALLALEKKCRMVRKRQCLLPLPFPYSDAIVSHTFYILGWGCIRNVFGSHRSAESLLGCGA